MTVSLRPVILAISLSAFAAASSSIVCAQPNGTQAAPQPGQTGTAPPNAAAPSGDPILTQVTNPNGSITSTWTAPDGTVIAINTFTKNDDGTTTWNSDYYQGGNLYSSTTYITNADGSSVSNTHYADGRSVVINADATGKITEMKETPAPAKPQAVTSQPSESENVAATPAPATEPPTEVTVEPYESVGSHFAAIKITYTPSAAKVGGGSNATASEIPVDAAHNARIHELEIFLQTPPELKISHAGLVRIYTGTLSHPQLQLSQSLGAVWPDAVTGRSYGWCIPLSRSTEICDIPEGPSVATPTPGPTIQATIYLPTFLQSNQIPGLHLDLSGVAVDRTPDGTNVLISPLNFNFDGNSTPHVSVNVAPAPNGPTIATLSPELTGNAASSSQSSNLPSDWYIDVIVRDLSVDPFNQAAPTSWKIYDNVWGITAKTNTPSPTNAIPAPGSGPAVPNPSAPNNSVSGTGPTTTPSTPETPLSAQPLSLPNITPTQTTQVDNTDYGTGGKQVLQTFANGTIVGTVYDSNNKPRRVETNTYTTNYGKLGLLDQSSLVYFDEDGHLQIYATFRCGQPSQGFSGFCNTEPSTGSTMFSVGSAPSTSSSAGPPSTSGTVSSGFPSVVPGMTVGGSGIPSGTTMQTTSTGTGTSSTFSGAGTSNTIDFTEYGLHGERTSEETTSYFPDHYEIKDWNGGTGKWSSTSIPYKFTAPPGSTTPTPAPFTPTLVKLAIICPRAYGPGMKIDCSVGPASYLDGFSSIPGQDVVDFSTFVPHLPDGSYFWPSLRAGVQNEGYFPIFPDGTFTVQVPKSLEGPLSLQVRLAGTYPGVTSTPVQLNLDNPVAAPKLPTDTFPSEAEAVLKSLIEDQLIHLWLVGYNEAEGGNYATISDNYLDFVEDKLHDDTYSAIDSVTSILPTSDVIALAHGLTNEAKGFQSWLSTQPTLADDDKSELEESTHWVNFLNKEADYAKFRSTWGPSNPYLGPYFVNPIVTQGKLNVVRGPLGDHLSGTQISIDNRPITPLAATPTEFYYMLPTDLTPGPHQLVINSPFFPETTFPVTNMTLSMGASDLNLRKGQKATYFAELDIFKGSSLTAIPNALTGPAFYETDIIPHDETNQIQHAAPSSGTGFFTLSVNNESKTTIVSPDQFVAKPASEVLPSGYLRIDGTMTALRAGGFVLIGTGRGISAPEVGIGSIPGSSTPSTGDPTGNWLPSFNISYNPSAPPSLPPMTNCSATATTPTAGTPTNPATTPTTIGSSTTPSLCGENVEEELYKQAMGNSTAVPVDNTTDNKPALHAAIVREEEAIHNAKAARERFHVLENALAQALNKAIDDAPKEFLDAVHKAAERYWPASDALKKAQSDFSKDPSSKNQFNLVIAQVEETDAEKAEEQARQNLYDHFTPEDRNALDQARAPEQQALQELDKAEAELHDAQNALGQLQRASMK